MYKLYAIVVRMISLFYEIVEGRKKSLVDRGKRNRRRTVDGNKCCWLTGKEKYT